MNVLSATVFRIQRQDSLCLFELDASGIPMYMLLFDPDSSVSEGCRVNVLFKETEVSIANSSSTQTTILNSFPAIIRKIRTGRILADIGLQSAAGSIQSIITMIALENLQLRENDTVTVLIKASQLSLETIPENRSCDS
ncbi:MAG: TOBE domain-containing protein [Chlorobiaceae bacterium]|nr:TOBE domain-containing protein [Chlorobiaceae bacterium]NTV60278.1 TOBE domain-containing protein [Chlorobiaceae bacterium]